MVNRVEVPNYTADNFEGENLPEIMPDYKVELGFGEGNKLNVTSDPATVESAKAEINNIVEELGDTAEDVRDDAESISRVNRSQPRCKSLEQNEDEYY